MSDYKSTVLLCYTGDDHCPVCRFLDGDHTVETLLEVIHRMDVSLANSERCCHRLVEAWPVQDEADE